MSTDKLLTTEDIRKMSLKEFMNYRYSIPEYQITPMWKLQCANIDWLIIDELEHTKSIKRLRQFAKELKEDLWYDIQNNRYKEK